MQEDDRRQRSRRDQERSAPVISSVRPPTVHRSHRLWITLEGSGFSRQQRVRIEGEEGRVVETRFESGNRLLVLIEIADGREDGELLIRVTGGGAPPSEQAAIGVLACPVAGMSTIPAGPFVYGSNLGSAAERPERELSLPSLAVGLKEVSNIEYLEFLNEIQLHGDHSLCHPDEGPLKSHVPDGWDDARRRSPSAPVTGIDWYDAYAYAAWRGRRLPTEEEWEKAARGTEGALFPWGDEADATRANAGSAVMVLSSTAGFPQGRSPYGLHHAAGNVWEWTASAGPDAGLAVMRGGSFRTALPGCRCFVRNWLDRRSRRDDVGFRCAADI